VSVLTGQELDAAVATLEGWAVKEGALEKAYDRADFAGSLAFVNRVGAAAEEADHHPDVAISWATVTLRWVSHSEGGITDGDVEMARRSDAIARDA
jgi:4a-hydroxytetrahydrobiopterin dehydratase